MPSGVRDDFDLDPSRRYCAFPDINRGGSLSSEMSTLTEIQDAVARLPHAGRVALQVWLNSLTEPEMSAEEEARPLRSLDDAIRDLDADKGVAIDEVRQQVGSWAGR